MEWLEKRSGGCSFTCSLPKLKKGNPYLEDHLLILDCDLDLDLDLPGNPYLEDQIPEIFVRLMCGNYCVGILIYSILIMILILIFVKLMCGNYCVGYRRFHYDMRSRKELGQAKIKWYSLNADRFEKVREPLTPKPLTQNY